MITRKQALEAIAQHYDLSLLYELEPHRTEFLVDLAFECISMEESKQSALAGLMQYATRLVGSNAVCPEFRMPKYERVLRGYLDWLLSSPEPEDVEHEVAS